jgi:ATP-dependent RNA helicase RhlE
VTIALQRQAAPAVGITQAAYPVPQQLKSALLVELITRGIMTQALVFTRTKHRANRLAKSLVHSGVNAERIHGNRSQAQRTQALAGFKRGRYPVLVATDIAARGIDVEALSHVINFDVPAAPEDYIHRVGRTGRAEMSGEAFTFVSLDEEPDLRAIERAIGKSLPRVTLPDFDYKAQAVPLEVPLKDRIAAIRQRKREERERARLNAARRAAGARSASGDQQGGNTDGARGARGPHPGTRGARPHGAKNRSRGGSPSRNFRPRGSRRSPS